MSSTTRGSSRRSSLRLLVAASTALFLFGCGTPDGDPSQTTSPPTSSGPAVEAATLYFVADTPQGLRLYPEVHQVTVDGDLTESAMALLIAGEQPFDPDYVNLWASKSNELLSLTEEGETTVLDLDYGGLNVGSAGEAIAVQQLMWTLKELGSHTETLTVLSSGETLDTLAGHLDASVPFELTREYEAIAAVTIASPLADSTIEGAVTISGEACTFEANVAWRLFRDGTVVDLGSTLASEACPTRSPWTVELGNLKPGIYVFRAFEASMKDGSIVAQETKSFLVK